MDGLINESRDESNKKDDTFISDKNGEEFRNTSNIMSQHSLTGSFNGYYDEESQPIDNFKHKKECVNLIQQMLKRNVNERISVDEILNHDWCTRNHNKTNTNIIYKGKKIIENLKNFKKSNNWWSLALYRFFIHQIVTDADKQEIEEVFKYLDEDYGGELDRTELENGLRKIDKTITSNIP